MSIFKSKALKRFTKNADKVALAATIGSIGVHLVRKAMEADGQRALKKQREYNALYLPTTK